MAGRLQVIPLRLLYFRIQSARTLNNITSVCVCTFITLLMNKLQPCGMVWWCGLLEKKREEETHTGSHTPMHTLQSPVAYLPPSLCSPQLTHMHTHKYTHTQPQGPQCSRPVRPSAHAERWAGSTYHHSAEWRPQTHTHIHTHTRIHTCTHTTQSAQGGCEV